MEIKEAINICSILYKKKHLSEKEKDALSQLMQTVIYEVLERSDNSNYQTPSLKTLRPNRLKATSDSCERCTQC